MESGLDYEQSNQTQGLSHSAVCFLQTLVLGYTGRLTHIAVKIILYPRHLVQSFLKCGC